MIETERLVRVGGHEVFVSVRSGDNASAPPLLMLMGLGGNVGMWEPLRGLLDAARPTIAFDVPGVGRSPGTRLPRPMVSLGRLTVAVLDRLGVDRVDLLGLSWGGLLAQQVAVTARGRVRRVVLANTNFGAGSLPGSPTAMRWLLGTGRYRSESGIGEAVRAFGGSGVMGPGMRQHVAARLAHPPSGRGYVHQLLALTGWSSLPLLPLLRRPVLLLAGAEDRAVPPLNAKVMARALPRAELVVVPGGGHLMLFEQADAVAPVITRFLDAAAPVRRLTSAPEAG